MRIDGAVALVTGGASGLGLATAGRLSAAGARVVLVDRITQDEWPHDEVPAGAILVSGDVAEESQIAQAFEIASGLGSLRAVVHCAGQGGGVRPLLSAEGEPDPDAVTHFESVVRTNLVGSFLVLRLAAIHMAHNEDIEGERGVCVLTSSIAAFEGQVGQIPYAASKAGIVGMTLVAARDLANHRIRVCTIAPGLFDTAMLAKLPADARARMEAAVPHPRRLGYADEFAQLALAIIENPMLNGETIRLDAANRLPSGI
ncbi:SDR family NAD(P)-dependent oxidoreductase [Sporichthya sp.]|uniref:SDR family NAD(P)-dependent oxidoreductase n=1 Tax=Sporichthya sp. TaxID=65475 RepID=UPI0017C4822A|nr:SDR family NAD(P)-dependent oxidoreductase [Sporichthya sp.]MBA3741366.1 SDR family NAD(P)-dependent oxidoreductase [Sporichthya sp.]